MFSVYQHFIKDGQEHMPYLAAFVQKAEAAWYAQRKLEIMTEGHIIIRERDTGMVWHIEK